MIELNYMNGLDSMLQTNSLLFLLLYVWSLFWKGAALWRAANGRQRNWFIALLVLNTVGILEIVYLFKFATKPLTFKELRSWTGR